MLVIINYIYKIIYSSLHDFVKDIKLLLYVLDLA